LNGKTLQILRYRLDLTQKEMADKLRISESLLAKLEVGICPISTRVKTRILSECKIDDELFEMVRKLKLFDGELI
jgi:transcriptional regulator with XRE-family HTH domain